MAFTGTTTTRNAPNDCYCGHGALSHTASTCLLCIIANPSDTHTFKTTSEYNPAATYPQQSSLNSQR